MSSLNTFLRTKYRDPELRKVVKYGMVSGVSVVVTLGTQIIFRHLFGDAKDRWATTAAAITGAIPSYYLNRMWVWGKAGKSHLKREVIPFWIMFFIGLGFALGATWIAVHITADGSTAEDILVPTFTFLAYGILWVLKYILFNKVLFVHRPQDLDPVLDGRSGIPT